MGEITIYFAGICTHMQWPQGEPAGALPGMRHRVVLVNGRKPREINGHAIGPHIPKLRVAARDLLFDGVAGATGSDCFIEWELSGCRLEVADAIGNLTHDPSFECCIPHLAKLTPDLPHPSVPVVIEAVPEKASCYFEVTAGDLSAGIIEKGAATAVLKVRTSGENPALRVRRFRTDTPQDIPLRSGTQIAIMNTGILNTDDASDFLLHYETAESIPPDARVPVVPAECCRQLAPAAVLPPLNVGPGCSNSAFP